MRGSGMIQAYWFFLVYVSPVLLVIFCAYLSWRAYTESRRSGGGEGSGVEVERPRAEAGEARSEREPWATDPEAWKEEG